jgi:hypothetical protein
MVVQLSYRKSLRWVPGEPSEPTSTLVLDVGSFFVDLRILKADGSIDWAMAGRRTVLSSSPRKFLPQLSKSRAPAKWTVMLMSC